MAEVKKNMMYIWDEKIGNITRRVTSVVCPRCGYPLNDW